MAFFFVVFVFSPPWAYPFSRCFPVSAIKHIELDHTWYCFFGVEKGLHSLYVCFGGFDFCHRHREVAGKVELKRETPNFAGTMQPGQSDRVDAATEGG